MTDRDNEQVPPERILWVEDEAARLFGGQRGPGKTNALARLLREMFSGRAETVKPGPDLAARLDAKRAEIERALPDLFPLMRFETGEPKWLPGTHEALHAPMLRITDGKSCYRPSGCTFELETPDWFPVRVGDVVRVIDIVYGDRPVPGHVVDVEGWWVYVSGPLGTRQPFYGQTGFRAGEYRWRLEPYIDEEESER